MITKDFHIGDVLTITTGELVSPHHMDGVYAILYGMTSDQIFTQHLPRVIKKCRPELLRQHPFLADIHPPEFDGDAEKVKAWVNVMIRQFGQMLPVTKLAGDDHHGVDPM